MNTLTFDNQAIKDYFEYNSEVAPVSELLYAHTHPLVRPTFVSEIESLIGLATEQAIKKDLKLNQGPFSKLISIAQKIGELVQHLDESSAPQCLALLRDVYTLCNKILK